MAVSTSSDLTRKPTDCKGGHCATATRYSELGEDGGARTKIRLSTICRRHVESLDGHRDQTVIAKDTNQIDSGVRPKPSDRPRVQIIAYRSCQVQLAAETVDKFLIRAVECGCRILSERDNEHFGKPASRAG